MILQDCYQSSKRQLQSAGIEQPALDARILMSHALGISQEDFIRQSDRVLTPEELHKIENVMTQRLAHKPVAKIVGHKEFYGLDFVTTEDTLDPRPDSETLIEAVLKECGKDDALRILDLGTGTGCLLLTLLHHLPNATGVGVDQSNAALAVAQKNAQYLHLADRSQFQQSNWFDQVKGIFDIIISNPPYIPSDNIAALPSDVRYDPNAALDGGVDGLDPYREITKEMSRFLKTGGCIAFEVGQGQADDVSNILKNNGFYSIQPFFDLGGIPRAVTAKYL